MNKKSKKELNKDYTECVCLEYAGGLNFTRKGKPIEDCCGCNGTGKILKDKK